MANADNPEKGKTEVEAVLREFDGKHELLKDFCSTTKALIERLLGEELVRYQHVQSRVKARDKLKEKYLDAQKDYRRLDDITDQAALRVITYYEDEIDGVVEIIKREFEIDATKSIDKRETRPTNSAIMRSTMSVSTPPDAYPFPNTKSSLASGARYRSPQYYVTRGLR